MTTRETTTNTASGLRGWRAACEHAEAAARVWSSPRRVMAPNVSPAPARWLAIGDPQTTPARFFEVLARTGLLGDDGLLDPSVGLVSMGDHFDFGAADLADAERSGRAILGWLAAHAPSQVIILLGNHDAARVIELAHETDASFADARQLAAEIAHAGAGGGPAEAERRCFRERFPHIPTPETAARDYSTFSVAQRAMVQDLLLAGRFQLATTARVVDRPALLTHAGVTRRELELLGVGGESGSDAIEPDAASRRTLMTAAIAAALNRHLARAVERVADRWRRGEPAALDLAPLHVAGIAGEEGGGLLYHRPARRDPSGEEDHWRFHHDRPRRFEPSTLPSNLLQVAAHTGHGKCVAELGAFVAPAAAAIERVSIRTLRAGPGEPRYVLGVEPSDDHGSLVLIEPSLAHGAVETVELLPLVR